MPTERSIAEAARWADLDPARALQILEECAARALSPAKIHLKAKAALIQAQAAINLNQFSDAIQLQLQEGAMILAANRRHDDWCQAMGLLSSLAFSRGNIPLTIAASIQGFRETRAPSQLRLLASRGALWTLSHQPGDIGVKFIEEVRLLIRTADPSVGCLVAKSYMAWRDFKRILLDAGIATDSHPYPGSVPSLTTDDAKRETLRLIASMEPLVPELRKVVRQEPVLMLLLAGMKGFVAGSNATRELALEVLRECGRPVEASVHSVIGVSHCRNGEFELAKHHLELAIDGHRRDGREHLGVTWYFYLAQACSELGLYQEAYQALSRFHAGRQSLVDPFVYQHMLEQATTQMSLADVEIGDTDAAPRHLQSVPPHLKKALAWMEANLASDIGVLDIVSVTGVSRRTIESAFRAYSESSIMEELKGMRLRRARRLLRTEGAKVASVMKQVGYKSASAFSRDFRKAFGVSPRSV